MTQPTNTKLCTVVNLRKDDYDTYIGRGSVWGNPFSHLPNSSATYRVGSRQESVDRYREYIMKSPYLLETLHVLKGKTLGCYCKPLACHGDIIAELVNNLKDED